MFIPNPRQIKIKLRQLEIEESNISLKFMVIELYKNRELETLEEQKKDLSNQYFLQTGKYPNGL